MNQVIIGLGSNIDPYTNVVKAKELLGRKLKILAESRFVVTKPVGPNAHQPDFLNGALLAETDLDPEELKIYLKEVESILGRDPSKGKGYCPRTIDLDILVWNGKVIGQDFHERDFVRASVLELLPQLAGQG